MDRQLDEENSRESRGERCRGSSVRAGVENRGVTGAEGKLKTKGRLGREACGLDIVEC